MRALVCLLLAGCASAPATIDDATPPDLVPATDGGWLEVVSHLEPRGAVSMSFRVLQDTRCTLFWALHHKPSSDSWEDPHTRLLINGQDSTTVMHAGWISAVDGRVTVGPLDTEHVAKHLREAGDRVLGTPDTFTSWEGHPDVALSAGDHVEMVAMAHAALLDNGTGETEGGSMRLAIGCDAPVEPIAAREDPEAVWSPGSQAEHDTAAFVPGFHVLAGSLDLETHGPETVFEFSYSLGAGTIRLPWGDPFEYEHLGPEGPASRSWTGPSGALSVAWETRHHGGGWTMGIWSWEEAPAPALAGPHAWPWQ